MTILEKIEVKEVSPKTNKCTCTNKHVPNPMKLMEISYDDTTLVVCPTFLINLVDLLDAYTLHSGPPPGRVTKHYGKPIRDLARTLWTGP